MFGLSIPATVSKSVELLDKATTRHLDEALAKENAKQLDHTLAVSQHEENRKLHRMESAKKHDLRLATKLQNMTSVNEKEQAILDAFRKA